MKNNIFIINGQKTCGKDYFANALNMHMGFGSTINISTVDVIKQMYELIGYKENDPEIKEKFRVVLSDAKDSIDANLNNWTMYNCVQRAIDKMEYTGLQPIFIHNREPEKIALMVKEFKSRGYDVRTLQVKADWLDGVEQVVTCHADANQDKYDYDLTFNNTKDPKEFSKRVEEFRTNHIHEYEETI